MDRNGHVVQSAPETHTPATKKIIKVQQSKTSTTLNDFLIKHRCIKKAAGDTAENPASVATHTRIGDESANIHGGSYHIPDEEYDTFMQLYFRDVVEKNALEYLTEKQLAGGNGPIAVDLDLHFAVDVSERIYEKDHLDDLVDGYLAELKTIFQFDGETRFPVFLFEKAEVNRVPDKKMTKDGIHMIFGIQMDHTAQRILRERMIKTVSEMWGDFPIINTWQDVFDQGISFGYTNWQLYGSRKPNHDAYKLTHVYEISYDPDDGECICVAGNPADYMTASNFQKLSVRYTGHPQFFYKSAFAQEVAALNDGQNRNRRSPGLPENTVVSSLGDEEASSMQIRDISRIRSREELEHCLYRFLDSLSSREYTLREIYEYTMILPESYFGEGSYAKWIRVGWALKNTSSRLLIVWLAFSAKSSTFQYSNIPDLCDQWSKFDRKGCGGVTNRSIIYWAMNDNRDGFDAVRKNTVSHYLDQTINRISVDSLNKPDRNAKGCGDYDIAVVLHQMYKDEYICADVKNGIWYRFRNHRWKQIDSGSTLRLAISKELRELYEKRAEEMANYKSTLDPEDEKYKIISARIEIVLKIYLRLGQTSDKKNIMQEAKDLFYDAEFDFHNRLDSNPYLMCFNNGVIDFKEKCFRKGLPEDYLTKCTGIDYRPLNAMSHGTVPDELNDFMAKLFPDTELREYMWDHLSSVLIGTASVNQTFNNYIGIGANGKSVLTDLMSQTLGNYKVSAPISIMTQPRVKVGGASPEIASLQGARYVVMQEPSKGDVIHEGPMKEYVSGVEPITARALYMPPVTFIPQCKFVVCCNEFMGVKSNDDGTWRRIRVVPFVSKFTETPVHDDPDKPHQFKLDRHLKDKFPAWRETFAAMLVERAFLTNGVVSDCSVVLAASNAYRDRQDYLSEFVRDKIMRCPGANVRKSQLSEEFKVWYSINYGTRNPSPKDLHEYMDKQFGKQRGGVWMGVKLKYNDDESDFAEQNVEVEDDMSGDIDLHEL